MITDYTKLPTLLQSRKHWVLCGVPGAADPKHPRQAKHPQWGADSTNPATWADFATASAAVMLDDADGMGYVFAKDDGLVFIDGDHCLGADGRPLPPHCQTAASIKSTSTAARWPSSCTTATAMWP